MDHKPLSLDLIFHSGRCFHYVALPGHIQYLPFLTDKYTVSWKPLRKIINSAVSFSVKRCDTSRSDC